MAYSKEIKAVAIKMMLPPNSKPLSHINEQTNIPIETLAKWWKELRKNGQATPSANGHHAQAIIEFDSYKSMSSR